MDKKTPHVSPYVYTPNSILITIILIVLRKLPPYWQSRRECSMLPFALIRTRGMNAMSILRLEMPGMALTDDAAVVYTLHHPGVIR